MLATMIDTPLRAPPITQPYAAYPEQLQYVGHHDGNSAKSATYNPSHRLAQASRIWTVTPGFLWQNSTLTLILTASKS
jgi:hypothetical protein